jgi:hypothetical protein
MEGKKPNRGQKVRRRKEKESPEEKTERNNQQINN